MRVIWVSLLLKSDRFSISFSLSVKNSFQRAEPLTGILYFDSLNPFIPNTPFVFPLKTSKNLTVF